MALSLINSLVLLLKAPPTWAGVHLVDSPAVPHSSCNRLSIFILPICFLMLFICVWSILFHLAWWHHLVHSSKLRSNVTPTVKSSDTFLLLPHIIMELCLFFDSSLSLLLNFPLRVVSYPVYLSVLRIWLSAWYIVLSKSLGKETMKNQILINTESFIGFNFVFFFLRFKS